MNTQKLKQMDKDYVWHPFTQMKEWTDDEILVIERGEGCYLIDSDGKRYLDGVSSLWVNVHGHRCQKIDQAIKDQVDKLGHSTLLGLSNKPSIELAKKLVEITPDGLNKVFYSDAGATAVEIGLKMAFQYWKLKGENRTTFIKFKNTYHGDTIGSVSVGGMKVFHDIFGPLLFDTIEINWPHTYWKPKNMSIDEWKNKSLSDLENVLKEKGDMISALITEPLIQGASGMSLAPKYFLKGCEQLCRQYGILFIVDEVATGFGRTGKLFACEHEDVKPDIMTVAKGLTGGYLPLAATLVTDEIYSAFLGDYKDFKTFFHGHTYTGNPLGAAAAIANIDLFHETKLIDQVQNKMKLFECELKELETLKHVGDIRHLGMMIGVELIFDKDSQTPYPVTDKMGMKVCKLIRSYGIILRPLGNVIVIMPPLVINEDEIKHLVNSLEECIVKITESYSK